ncbi:MAG: hypothetical protein EZS28_032032 [Streblomastix strix]|uniref:Uncharacterized protein n=1 Tax=Streblomastix strix TaxID=222440 RepID=A0A5J4UQW3_9EUKA|nr:MAG: hypothetical protein EZS28_032032 [Streblomastix strix]
MEKVKDNVTNNLQQPSRFKSYRAMNAVENGREPGKNGRPQYLNDDEEELLENIILIDAAGLDFPTFDEICFLANQVKCGSRQRMDVEFELPSKRWAHYYVFDREKLHALKPSEVELA